MCGRMQTQGPSDTVLTPSPQWTSPVSRGTGTPDQLAGIEGMQLFFRDDRRTDRHRRTVRALARTNVLRRRHSERGEVTRQPDREWPAGISVGVTIGRLLQ